VVVHNHDVSVAGRAVVRPQGFDWLRRAFLASGTEAEVPEVLVGLVTAFKQVSELRRADLVGRDVGVLDGSH
jgi:hypothetical protein